MVGGRQGAFRGALFGEAMQDLGLGLNAEDHCMT
jgi:hypothetical protein